MTSQSTGRALIVQEDGTVKPEPRPIPKVGDNDVLIKVSVIGLNPTDQKHVRGKLAKPGDISGCDAVGKVIESGAKVPKSYIGTRRGFFTRGGQSPTHGAFADYVAMPYDVTFEIPDNITDEQAATLPIPFFTAVQALFHPFKLNLPEPSVSGPIHPNGRWILIWSASSAVGLYAVQLAKLAGFNVAATASESGWAFLKSLGADVLVDYKDPQVVEKLKQATNDAIELGLDCVSIGDSTALAQKAFRPQGGRLVTLLFPKQEELPRQDVKAVHVLLYTALTGADATFGAAQVPGYPEDRSLHVKWQGILTELLKANKLKFIPITRRGGLEDVQKSYEFMRDGKVKQEKLVHLL